MKILMKIKTRYIYFFLTICVLAICTTACKSGKEIKGSMKSYEAEELFSIIVNNPLEYQTFSGKMKTSLRLGKNDMDISTNLKIIKDEKLQLSFQVPILGEMFRLSISEDSLVIIDRMNKQFVAESIQDIKQTASFDFELHNLQSLFTNRLFLVGKQELKTEDFRLFSVEQEKETMLIKAKDKNINYAFSVDYTDHIRNSAMVSNNKKTAMNWTYNNFSALENKQLFPMQMGMTLNSSEKKFSMNFAFSKIDLDKSVEIDLNIPKKYSRITLAQAMSLFNSIK